MSDGTVTVEPASYLPASVLDDLASPDSNIVTLAARLLAATAVAPDELSLVDLLVEKRIPVAGGMAGGSADAAATLLLELAPDRVSGADAGRRRRRSRRPG